MIENVWISIKDSSWIVPLLVRVFHVHFSMNRLDVHLTYLELTKLFKALIWSCVCTTSTWYLLTVCKTETTFRYIATFCSTGSNKCARHHHTSHTMWSPWKHVLCVYIISWQQFVTMNVVGQFFPFVQWQRRLWSMFFPPAHLRSGELAQLPGSVESRCIDEKTSNLILLTESPWALQIGMFWKIWEYLHTILELLGQF